MGGACLEGRKRLLLPLALVVLGAAAMGIAVGQAAGETGAPALEPDGVWRARGDWSIGEGELVVHDGERLEAFGNVSVGGNATLVLVNGSLIFLDTVGAPRVFAADPGALVQIMNASITAHGSFAFDFRGAILEAETCAVRFTGTFGPAPSIRVVDGAVLVTDCQVYSDAETALEARASRVETMDSDFVTQGGQGGHILFTGPALHALDTTRFGNLSLRGGAAVTLYATVRFFLESPGGEPSAGHVNGTGPYGEAFSLDTAPEAAAAIRFVWYRSGTGDENVTEGTVHAPWPADFTALNASVGGNNTVAWVTHHRENITVVLDGEWDVGVTVFRVADNALDGPPLKRAYYLELGANTTLTFTIQNFGPFRSASEAIWVSRVPLNPSTWAPAGAPVEVAHFLAPPLDPNETWTQSVSFTADAFGGDSNSTTPCTETHSYTAAYYLHAVQAPTIPRDFAAWNDVRSLTTLTYEVKERPGTRCVETSDAVLPLIAAGAAGAVGVAAALSFYFSDHRVAKRASGKGERDAERGQPPKP